MVSLMNYSQYLGWGGGWNDTYLIEPFPDIRKKWNTSHLIVWGHFGLDAKTWRGPYQKEKLLASCSHEHRHKNTQQNISTSNAAKCQKENAWCVSGVYLRKHRFEISECTSPSVSLPSLNGSVLQPLGKQGRPHLGGQRGPAVAREGCQRRRHLHRGSAWSAGR